MGTCAITLVCAWVCVCLHNCVWEHSSERTHKHLSAPAFVYPLNFSSSHNACVCTYKGFAAASLRSSVYKWMDTIKQRDQTDRFVCVREPRDRHKRDRGRQRGEMKHRKACFPGSGVPWQERHCGLWANYTYNKETRGETCHPLLCPLNTAHALHCMMPTLTCSKK